MKRAILCAVILLSCSMVNGQSQKNLSLEIVNGISIVNSDFSDFVKDGFNNEISIRKSFCDKLSLGMGVKHSSFNVRQEFGQTSGSRNQFRSIGFDMGPQFSFGSDRFSLKLYGRTGLAINSTPELISRYPNTDIVTSNLRQQSLNALTARLGAKLNTELCKGIQLFVSSEYLTSLNGDISYQSKDISKAIRADGSIDPDLASEIPTTSTSFNFTSINVNFGVSIAIGKLGNHPNRRSSNPLYQDKGNKAVNPMYQPRSSGNNNPLYQQSGNQGSNVLYEGANNSGGNSGQNSGTRAQDYNSSRSNTTTAGQLDNQDEKDEIDPISTATDYNSSRSNKADGAIENPNGENNSGTRAQDYNSSRSNTTTAIELDNQDEKDETDPISTATDYNSSRSNKADGAIENPNDGNNSGTRAQDYNSSRSNTTTAVELDNQDEKEEIDPISTATDYNSSRSNKADGAIENPNGGNNSGTRAQDYNSSRSNTTTAIELDNQDEKDETDPISTATDYNSSRSNKADGVIENPNGGNTSGTRAQDYNSSRSNRGIAAPDDDIRVSMSRADKKKMKRKLKREKKQRLKEERRKRKSQANSIY